MTKMRMKKIFQDFIGGICEEIQNIGMTTDILLSIADEYEIKELGLGWLIDDEESDEDYF